jgi:hypothetical protein
MSRGRLVAVTFLMICGLASSHAEASQTVKLRVGFTPNHLGKSTTILVGFSIGTTSGRLPSPLTNFDLSLPRGMGFGTTTLGEQVCHPRQLEERGPPGCPPNSVMGRGEALVEVPPVVKEEVSIEIFMGPATDHHTSLLFYADGKSPISAQLIFPGVLLANSGPFGAHLNTAIPVVPSVPEGPDVAVVRMQSGLGPRNLTYYRYLHGRRISYHPIGLAVPEKCPRGGFPFSAEFTFQDGTSASSSNTVPCPGSHKPRRPRA